MLYYIFFSPQLNFSDQSCIILNNISSSTPSQSLAEHVSGLRHLDQLFYVNLSFKIQYWWIIFDLVWLSCAPTNTWQNTDLFNPVQSTCNLIKNLIFKCGIYKFHSQNYPVPDHQERESKKKAQRAAYVANQGCPAVYFNFLLRNELNITQSVGIFSLSAEHKYIYVLITSWHNSFSTKTNQCPKK